MLYLPLEIVAPVIADCSEGKVAIPELKAPMIDDVRLSRIFTAARAALIEEKDGEVFNELLQVLLGALFNSKVQPAPAAPHRLIQAREWIDDDPAAGHSLVDLASLVGASRFQTLRAFAELTGLTPHAYVIQRRLDAARRLIRGGSSLASAAAGAGFADQSHMHRAFIARYGYTPGAYRGADLQFRSRAS
jgi:AraC-like DNA-binding protein